MGDILFTNRLFAATSSGGSYEELSGKPKINNVTLSGNKTTHQLGMFEQLTTMPTASSAYSNKVVQFIGTTTSDYEQGLFYICEENAGTYSWNHLQVEQIATSTDFGLVKPDGTTITISNGVISAAGGSGAKLYTLDGLSITSTNTDIRTILQAVDAKNLPVGSIVTGAVDLTDAPADNISNSNIRIESYTFTEGSTTNTIYRATLTSQGAAPYQWFIEYWNTHPQGSMTWVEAPLAFYNMPTASSKYVNKIAQFVGSDDGIHVQGKFYICQEVTSTTPTTYEWVLTHVEPVGSSADFGIVKVDNSSIVANSGVITANKATGAYSTTFVGNPATTNSSTNVGANSEVFGYYSVSLGCDSKVGDSANDVRVPGAIQLGRGSNQEAGSLSVGLSVNGTSWNNYKLLGSDGIIPAARIDFPVEDVQINSTSILSSGVANIPYAGSTNAGVIKTNTSYGTSTNSDGVLQAETKTYAEYNSIANTLIVGKGTLENVITGKALEDTTGTFASGSTVTLAKNKTFTGTSITAVTVAYPATLDASFVSEVDFTTGTGTITFAVDSGTIIKGDDVASSVFSPQASSTYSIIFSYNGATKYGIVVKLS